MAAATSTAEATAELQQAARASSYAAERLNPDFGFYLKNSQLLVSRQSPWQHIEVFENAQFGRVMRIDDCFMTSERDEFFYHEPMVHLPAIAHPGVRRALVVGGGDGGAVEELLKLPHIERVVLAELDAEVIEVAREWLGNVHHGALDDPRVELRIGDARSSKLFSGVTPGISWIGINDGRPANPAGPGRSAV